MLIAALFMGLLIGCGDSSDIGAEKDADGENPISGLKPLGERDPPPGNRAPELSGTPPAVAPADQNYRFIPGATDLDGDTLTFTVVNLPSWAMFDPSNGELSGVPVEADVGTYPNIRINVTDGEAAAALPPFSIEVQESPLTRALRTGDASLVDIATLYDAAVEYPETEVERCASVLDQIYPAGRPAATAVTRAVYPRSQSRANIPLHGRAGRTYAWLGERADAAGRYAVYGGDNTFERTPSAVDLGPSTLEVIKWLTRGLPGIDVHDTPLVFVMPSNTDRNRLQRWIDSNNIAHQWTLSTDTSRIASGDFDIYFSTFRSDLGAIDVFNSVLDQGKPVMTYPAWVGAVQEIFDVFELTTSGRGATDAINEFASNREFCAAADPEEKTLIGSVIKNLRDRRLDFIYTEENCPNSFGTVKCEGDVPVVDPAGNTLEELFLDGARVVRSQLKALDFDGTNVFGLGDGSRMLKLAVLLGGKLRETITYPMDRDLTDQTEFFSAYFADHTVHQARPNNRFQPDLGDYEPQPAVINALPGIDFTYTSTPRFANDLDALGIYAPPGVPITVRRTDSGTNRIRLRFGVVRNTVRLYNPNWAYTSPKFQTSHHINLEANTSYTLSSPYGAPLFIRTDGVAENPQPFTLEFSGVVRHPFINDFSTPSIQQYLTELEAGVFHWTDIETAAVEIHSLRENMLISFARHDGDESNGYTTDDVVDYLNNVNTYLVGRNLNLAGFTGETAGPFDPDVSAFCTARNLDCTDPVIHRLPATFHMNSDNKAACGAGCSGNPFDSGSPIASLGWLPGHELGHGLQTRRFMPYKRAGEVQNNIFPIYMNFEWARDQGLAVHPETRGWGDHRDAFTQLQLAVRTNIGPSIDHPMWGDPGGYANGSARLAFYVQLVYIHGSWNIYPKMYLLQRIFRDAIESDTQWNTAAADLGFSTYTRQEAIDIDPLGGNNFLYIAASLVDGRDFADYMEVWGIELSAKAKAQVQANGAVGTVPRLMYYVQDQTLFTTLPNTAANERALDGVTAWDPPASMASSAPATIRENLAGAASATNTNETSHGALLFAAAAAPTGLAAQRAAAALASTPVSTADSALESPISPLTAPTTVAASPPGGVFFEPVTVSFNCSDPGNDCESVFYTLDGGAPTTTSLLFAAPFTLNETTTLRFIAVDASGEASPIETEDYLLNPTAPPVVEATPPGGDFDDPVQLTLICTGARDCDTIFFTLDGTTPTSESTRFDGPITIEQTTTVRYLGVDIDGTTSPVGTDEYTILVPPALPIAIVQPDGGNFTSPVEITLTCIDPDEDCVALFYTLDGSQPTPQSVVFTAPFTISEPAALRVIAQDAAGNLSTQIGAAFNIAPVVVTPDAPSVTASPPGGTFENSTVVTLTCTDPDGDCAGIRFTIDGSEPTDRVGLFTAPISLEQTTTLRFFAFDAQGNRSATVTETYGIDEPPPPSIPVVAATPAGGDFDAPVQVSLSCFDTDNDCDRIFYTLDDTEPTPESIEFTAPFTLSVTTIVRIIATDTAGNVSRTATWLYRIGPASTAPTVSATPASGDFDTPVQVTLSCSDPDNDCDAVFYTLDGSEPTTASIRFTSPFVLNETTTVRAIATDLQGNTSPVATETYTTAILGIAAPGGVSDNLQLWLKANMGTDAVLDGDVVARWPDQSDNANDAVTAGTVGTAPSLELNEFNFNPVIRFTDDGGRHLRSPSNPVSGDMSVIAVFRTSQTDDGVFWNAPA
ncbi:MAG: ImpA family metalloprotease, partial [Gammaproteobacteria bacterium]